jgi:hypothetical protein
MATEKQIQDRIARLSTDIGAFDAYFAKQPKAPDVAKGWESFKANWLAFRGVDIATLAQNGDDTMHELDKIQAGLENWQNRPKEYNLPAKTTAATAVVSETTSIAPVLIIGGLIGLGVYLIATKS